MMRLRRFLFALVEGASVYLFCCRFGVGVGVGRWFLLWMLLWVYLLGGVLLL